jgi:hypothetical protein
MSPNSDRNRDNTVGEQSERQKSPGRVAHITRVNEEKKRRRERGETVEDEQVGRPLEHGEYALVARYKAGMSPENPVYPLIVKHRDDFLADLGGEENASGKEREGCQQLGFLAVLHRMQIARFGSAKRMSRKDFFELSQAITRTAATFAQIAKQLGFKRQLKDMDKRTIIVRRYSDASTVNDGNRQESQG